MVEQEDKIYTIDNVDYIEDSAPVIEDDILTIIDMTNLRKDIGLKIGSQGKLLLWYDRVVFEGVGEAIYWPNVFKKLVLKP